MRTVVEVDFFEEAGGELIVLEENVLGGVDARVAVLTEPPEGQRAEDRDWLAGGGDGVVGLEDVGPDDGVTVQDGGAVGEAKVNALLGSGFETGESCLPGRVEVVR